MARQLRVVSLVDDAHAASAEPFDELEAIDARPGRENVVVRRRGWRSGALIAKQLGALIRVVLERGHDHILQRLARRLETCSWDFAEQGPWLSRKRRRR
jgi:hypothetical protein